MSLTAPKESFGQRTQRFRKGGTKPVRRGSFICFIFANLTLDVIFYIGEDCYFNSSSTCCEAFLLSTLVMIFLIVPFPSIIKVVRSVPI